MELALEGRISVFKRTWPWGKAEEEVPFGAASPEFAAKQLMNFVQQRQQHDARHKPKK